MQAWKLTLEYDGSRYRGWQAQKNARTVQGELKAALEEILGTEVELQGAGRTDAGVHARHQVAHVRARSVRRFAGPDLLAILNERLPYDISVLALEPAHPRFHARHHAASRTYVYQMSLRKQAFAKKYVWWIRQSLDFDRMVQAVSLLTGRHDFVCFRAADPDRPEESTLVVVESAELLREGDLILFRISGSHFLWRMVRRLVGALVKVGTGAISLEEFRRLLSGECNPDLAVAEWTAPAAGLFLERVTYPDKLEFPRTIRAAGGRSCVRNKRPR